MNDPVIQDEVNKRLTLNLLIQGAGSHMHLSGHEPVEEELAFLGPDVLERYKTIAAALYMAQYSSDFAWMFGGQNCFWRRIHRPDHPYRYFPFLRKHGLTLCKSGKRYAMQRARQAGIRTWPVWRNIYLNWLVIGMGKMHKDIREDLQVLARRSASRTWGIEVDRLSVEITPECETHLPINTRSWRGKLIKLAAVGWSNVERLPDGRLGVNASAICWPLLIHELSKGIAELICLRGLNTLDELSYEKVIQKTDIIENELSMLKAGPDLYRRLLGVIEPPHTPAQALMHLSQLPPVDLEQFVFALVEDAPKARRLLGDLLDAYVDPPAYFEMSS
ncbi:MAG: hypothetical protein AAGB26_01940 [Planctomycetota bacterium]